jgi:hypothetical protein
MEKIVACVLIVLLVVSVPAFARPTARENADFVVDAIIGISLGIVKRAGTALAVVYTAADFITYAVTGKTIGGYANDGFEKSSKIIYADDNKPYRGWMGLGMQ